MWLSCTANWIICSTVLMCLFVLYIIIRVSAEVQSVNGLLFKPLQVGLGTLQVCQAAPPRRPEPQEPRVLAFFCTAPLTLVSAPFLVNRPQHIRELVSPHCAAPYGNTIRQGGPAVCTPWHVLWKCLTWLRSRGSKTLYCSRYLGSQKGFL